MRIQTNCCCGAEFTLDDGGRDDICTRNQFDARHAAWNALHAKCVAQPVNSIREVGREDGTSTHCVHAVLLEKYCEKCG